jgi:Ca2+-binding EF-hand superfamily protein
LYSTFSEQATRDVKTTFAFKIYDFDNDGLIGKLYFLCARLYSGKMEGYF